MFVSAGTHTSVLPVVFGCGSLSGTRKVVTTVKQMDWDPQKHFNGKVRVTGLRKNKNVHVTFILWRGSLAATTRRTA